MDLRNLTGHITQVATEILSKDEPFLDIAARFADLDGTTLLMSGGDLDCARYHLLGVLPWLRFTCKRGRCIVTIDGQQHAFVADPFDVLRGLLQIPVPTDWVADLPLAAGLMGYWAYDLKDDVEQLPRTSIDRLDLPDLCLYAPSLIVVRDKSTRTTRLCTIRRSNAPDDAASNVRMLFETRMASPPPVAGDYTAATDKLRSNFEKDAYLDAVDAIKAYIASGHVYQVNMSQRFETAFEGDPFALFKTLYEANPAPFFAFINAGDHQIVSTSPERFIQRNGDRIETRPIKGTRPRGDTPEEDRRYKADLAASPKDDAELSMIVDLLRNDIGKVCTGGSVRVTTHKRLEAYQNVYHLVSIVDGKLAPDKDAVDLIRATFPGGSITGCPKIRAMEIIDELEPDRRHIYTGAIGYVSLHDTMDLSIAIRTATVSRGRITFSVGGGIVYDSDPADEYAETLHKGQTLMQGLAGCRPATATPPVRVWLDGQLTPQDQARVPVTASGFQYGYGFFETVRWEKGRVLRLDDHLQRFYHSWQHLFATPPPDLTWDAVINRVIFANRLQEGVAAVKILAAMGPRSQPILMVQARVYEPRPALAAKGGLDLAIYPHPRQTPLAGHKTLNYLYYFQAGQWARQQGRDEAIILNPDGSVSETNTANLLLLRDRAVILPVSGHVLPGIMQAAVRRRLLALGYHERMQRVVPADLFAADQVLATNSLMGAVPVLSVDGDALAQQADVCRALIEI